MSYELEDYKTPLRGYYKIINVRYAHYYKIRRLEILHSKSFGLRRAQPNRNWLFLIMNYEL